MFGKFVGVDHRTESQKKDDRFAFACGAVATVASTAVYTTIAYHIAKKKYDE